MNASLKLVNAASALAAQSSRPNRTPSPRQQEITANMSLISRTWRTLSDSQRQGWHAFGQQWSPIAGKSTAPGLVVFQSLNGVRLNTGQGNILPDAPSQPAFIGKLPPYYITAQSSPALSLSDAPGDPPNLTLYINSDDFPGPVQVLATRPLSAGTGQPDPKAFRQIALLPSLTDGLTNLASDYLAVFPPPAVGMKLALQLVPVTPNGFRGSPFTQIVTVTV